MEPIEKPVINPKELDDLCSLNLEEKDKHLFKDYADFQKHLNVVEFLSTRDIENELPIVEETFTYKRNIEECKALRLSLFKLLNKKVNDQSEVTALLEDASNFLALELKKAGWLEKNYYPAIFGKSINIAKGEVRQFLIKQRNTEILDEFPDLDGAVIRLQDELNYLIDGRNPETSGGYREGVIDIRIPELYTDRQEWVVYLVAIHELLHHASYRLRDRLGLYQVNSDPDLNELNEAVTEILAYTIAKRHLEKLKLPLKGEYSDLRQSHMAYDQYTQIVEGILTIIPLAFFTDAMLNKDGFERLTEKFEEEYGKKDSLVKFARELKNLRTLPVNNETKIPKSERTAEVVSLADFKNSKRGKRRIA